MLKKVLTPLLGIALLFSAAGCSLFGAEKVGEDTLEWYVDVVGFTDTEDTRLDKVIYEKTGVKIKFIYGGTEGSSTVLAGMINSNSLPDIISLPRVSTIYNEAIATNQLYSYDELFAQYGVEDFIPVKMRQWNNVDGKAYGVISHFGADDDAVGLANYVLIAQKDMLDECGIDPVEGFKDMASMKKSLMTVKNRHLNDKAFIPFFSQDGGQVLHEFLAIPKEDEDGNFVDWKATDQGKQLIKDMNDFYLNGLLTTESLANSMSEEEAIMSGRVFCMTAIWAEVFGRLQKSYDDLGKEWVAVGPLRNDNGDDPILSPWTQSGWLATAISKNCKNPEAALRLIRFLYSDEGQTLCTYGFEGETYTVNPDGTYSYTAEYLAADDNKINDDYGIGWTGALLYNTNYIEKMRGPSMSASRNAVDAIHDYFSKYTYESLAFEDIHPTTGDLFSYSVQAGNYFNWSALIRESNQSNIIEKYDAALDYINKTYHYGPVSEPGTVMNYYNQQFQARKQILGLKYAWPTNLKYNT